MAARGHASFSSVTRAADVTNLTSERRWRAVLARDRRYDGAFVYAVRSTGIYCRPSCASRKPRRDRVTFFPVPEAAEHAGFRPCRRCRPGAANPADPRVALVREVCRAIDAQPDAPARLTALSARAGTTPHRLLRAFRAVLGLSPRQYRDERRLDRFKIQLKRRKKVSPALYESGYGSTSRVYERAHAQLGMTPATYGRDGAGTHIAFAVVPCALGRLLVAATARGICRISLGDDADALERGLATEFPAVFAFLWEPGIDASNWRAEQAIRPADVARKICGGNRTRRGADTQQVLASVVRTIRQRCLDLTTVFTKLLRAPRPTVPAALQDRLQ